MKVNLVIPLAGKGSRFSEANYTFPKPLIDVEGEPMISKVIKNLIPENAEELEIQFHFIVQKEHLAKYDLENVLRRACTPFDCTITAIDGITEGAACTVLLATEHFNNEECLMLANSDQLVEAYEMKAWWAHTRRLMFGENNDKDASIMVFESSHPKWSYVRLAEDDSSDIVEEVAEKKVISNLATTGIYFFLHGKDFVEGASEMIRKNIRTNNEFYVCPVYNELVLAGKKVTVHKIVARNMHGIGTPEDLNTYLNSKK